MSPETSKAFTASAARPFRVDQLACIVMRTIIDSSDWLTMETLAERLGRWPSLIVLPPGEAEASIRAAVSVLMLAGWLEAYSPALASDYTPHRGLPPQALLTTHAWRKLTPEEREKALDWKLTPEERAA